jgi:hypothetical protein
MNEEQKEYQEHFSPDGERLQYLMEHPEENEPEQIREIARDLHCNIISVNDGVSAINLLLAKQQDEFVNIVKNRTGVIAYADTDKGTVERILISRDDLLADIKSKLNK